MKEVTHMYLRCVVIERWISIHKQQGAQEQ